MTDTAESRSSTAIDALAESYFEIAAQLDPLQATIGGLTDYDDRMPDLSPDGLERRDELAQQTLRQLAEASPVDEVDKVTVAAMRERLELQRELYALGIPPATCLNVTSSPVQDIRDVFDLMLTDSVEHWTTNTARLHALPAAVDGYIESLRLGAQQGNAAPKRQVRGCLAQCEANLGSDGFFARYARDANIDGTPLPAALQSDLDRAAGGAEQAYRRLRDFLADELLDLAPEKDACGIERYRPLSRYFLGAAVEPAEAYEWGKHELARIQRLMLETANEIKYGASVDEAIAILDSDPVRRLSGTDALQAWMQERSDAAVAALADTHFDIPEPVRRLECRIAPTNTGVIYYTGPSDDFSRPGRMWWSVPPGVTEFSTWRELTTVYHEGVPGHHLQIGQTVYRKQLLNTWRRLGSWISGHGEGWALYAEWLMADLGFMDDPANRLGLLDGQSMRAARVVIDIGVHCDFEAPEEVGGGAWNYDKAWQLLDANAHMAEKILRYELDRYLGWPGQAPSYKLGERLWLQLRDESKARLGSDFDLKAFHRKALDIGSVGLDVLRQAVLGEL
ncbi:MAG TPA: DUF885 domain-containing protein [Jatrophihabitans sp.]|nr:DUF885 domain-containing protein [Jatrophihabitans sp.]